MTEADSTYRAVMEGHVDFWGAPITNHSSGVARNLKPKPKPSVWPPPVYEAHYSDGRVLRMSFWSPAGKPVDPVARREIMQDEYYAQGAVMTAGYVCQGEARSADFPVVENAIEPKPAQRVTAKQAREQLGRLLACLDGSITDHDEIRNIVIECRKVAA